MRGHKRFRSGAWSLTVNANDPITGERKPVYRTVHAPNNKRGAAQADSELAKLVAEVEAGRELPGSGLTCTQLFEQWVARRRTSWERKSPGQADETLRRLRNHVLPHIGTELADKVVRRPILIADLYETLRATCSRAHRSTHDCADPDHECVPLAESTVRRIHNIVHSGFEWAWRHDIIARNPADHVDPPAIGKPRKTPPPAPVVVARLIEGAATGVDAGDEPALELACFIRLAALNGPRRGQNVALRWLAVDLDNGMILWARALAKVPGGVAEKGPKADVDPLPSSLDLITVMMLTKLLHQQRERAAAAGIELPADAYVFARDVEGRQPWHPDGATQRFKRLCRRLGEQHPDLVDVLKDVKLKDLRDYMATELLGAGVDPKVMADRGGWSETTTPLNKYAAFRPARDRAAAEALASGIDEAAGTS